MHLKDGRQLTYCGNIHPSNGLSDVLANLGRYVVPLKSRLAPSDPFGVGLRLSGAESREALEGDAPLRLAALLSERDLYVFTINGFPYGSFHGTAVKANVHSPDWRNPERADYTVRLARILAALLPNGAEGSISTSPLSYKPWFYDARLAGKNATSQHQMDVIIGGEEWERMLGHLALVVDELLRLREQGSYIHLDLEPEPDGLLEHSSEVVRFFQERLLTRGAELLAERAGLSRSEACRRLQEHVRVCFDTCHAAVAFEEPAEALGRLSRAGVRVGKVQVSSALEVTLPEPGPGRAPVGEALRRFDEPTYLHQVVQQNSDGSLTRYRDLPLALANLDDPQASRWRVHFHVPVFLPRYGRLASTQDAIVETFAALKASAATGHVGAGHREPRPRHAGHLKPGNGEPGRLDAGHLAPEHLGPGHLEPGHLEIETYTWDVLPDDLGLDLLDALEREYRWVLDVL